MLIKKLIVCLLLISFFISTLCSYPASFLAPPSGVGDGLLSDAVDRAEQIRKFQLAKNFLDEYETKNDYDAIFKQVRVLFDQKRLAEFLYGLLILNSHCDSIDMHNKLWNIIRVTDADEYNWAFSRSLVGSYKTIPHEIKNRLKKLSGEVNFTAHLIIARFMNLGITCIPLTEVLIEEYAKKERFDHCAKLCPFLMGDLKLHFRYYGDDDIIRAAEILKNILPYRWSTMNLRHFMIISGCFSEIFFILAQRETTQEYAKEMMMFLIDGDLCAEEFAERVIRTFNTDETVRYAFEITQHLINKGELMKKSNEIYTTYYFRMASRILERLAKNNPDKVLSFVKQLSRKSYHIDPDTELAKFVKREIERIEKSPSILYKWISYFHGRALRKSL